MTIKIKKSGKQYIAFENGKYIGESSRIRDLKAWLKNKKQNAYDFGVIEDADMGIIKKIENKFRRF